MAKIFLVEDNDNLREAVAGYLVLDGHEVVEFSRFRRFHDAVEKGKPDLMILDVMLPDGDGFLVAKKLSETQNIPVIFMTAKATESDRITGFEIGADDYIVKPFSPKELTLRVKAVLRRTAPGEEPKQNSWELNGNELQILDDAHQVLHDGENIQLTAAEWKILTHLADRAGIVVERTHLLTESLDYIAEGSERTIDTHIKNIRSKLGSAEWIETIRGFGYRFSGKAK
ncbi:MAG: response regulator transcription factor [Spirochaetales bacterium]|jgi:DNA-binding response OmpR family regulator|nr:response regulator transcription factor [Spirochaetales bacterium]